MNSGPTNFIPHSIDMSALVRRSVASLYSHLVTRPTGQALRMGIESQLADLGEFCVSILDFSQVVVLDYSCADEAVAKLILRYQRDDRPAEAYFIARGIAEQHLEPIESVLGRHDLALVADLDGEGYTLLGCASDVERMIWLALQQRGTATADDVMSACRLSGTETSYGLERLAQRRAILARGEQGFAALSALLT